MKSRVKIDKYVIFGTGQIGQRAVDFIEKDNVEGFVENNIKNEGKQIYGKNVCNYVHSRHYLQNKKIVVCVSEQNEKIINKHLKADNMNYISLRELRIEIIKERILNCPDYKCVYSKAIDWIRRNSIPNQGIINRMGLERAYPEVTGYFIPTLLRWGYIDLALQYAKWLCNIQKKNGSWYDTEDRVPYIFDTAQVLKGLLSIRSKLPEVDQHIKKGCGWILSCMSDEGRLITPTKDAWGKNLDMCDEVIHIYCLSPLIEASQIYNIPEYEDKARKILSYYKKNYYEKIINFKLMSHFYSYLMEALIDLGEIDLCREAMKNIEQFQNEKGAVPAYNDVHWVCSTGLFQLSMIWYRLGDVDRGEKAFKYAASLQNPSGGWCGSYESDEYENEYPDYLQDAEISWANKFFLDALYYRKMAMRNDNE